MMVGHHKGLGSACENCKCIVIATNNTIPSSSQPFSHHLLCIIGRWLLAKHGGCIWQLLTSDFCAVVMCV